MRRLRLMSNDVQSTGASPAARSRTAGPGPPATRRLPGRRVPLSSPPATDVLESAAAAAACPPLALTSACGLAAATAPEAASAGTVEPGPRPEVVPEVAGTGPACEVDEDAPPLKGSIAVEVLPAADSLGLKEVEGAAGGSARNGR